MATYDLKYPGAAIDAILDTAYDLQNAGYIFRGLASEYYNTPTERSWVLAGEGETGHGFTSPVPKGYIGVCVFNGTSWTGKLLKCVSIDSTPTSGSTNAVSSGGAYASISQLADTVNEALDNLTFTDTTPSAFLGDYIKMKVSTTDGGIERIMTYFTILAATASKAGLLSAADKAKLDAILGNLRSLEIDDTTAYADLGDKIVESIKATIGGTEETISTFQLLAATASKAGLLSAADKAKLDALWTSGYQFAGIATPSTTPLSTTSKIFYIATEAGTYFNAVTVTQGINILSWNGSAWSSAQVVGIDDEPTLGSDNLVTSNGVQVSKRLTYQNMYVYENHVMSRYNDEINIQSNNSYNIVIIRLTQPHGYITISGIDKESVKRVVFFDSAAWDDFTSSNVISFQEDVDSVKIAIPDNAEICAFSALKSDYPDGYGEIVVSYDNDIPVIKSDVVKAKDDIVQLESQETFDKYSKIKLFLATINSAGVFSPAPAGSTSYTRAAMRNYIKAPFQIKASSGFRTFILYKYTLNNDGTLTFVSNSEENTTVRLSVTDTSYVYRINFKKSDNTSILSSELDDIIDEFYNTSPETVVKDADNTWDKSIQSWSNVSMPYDASFHELASGIRLVKGATYTWSMELNAAMDQDSQVNVWLRHIDNTSHDARIVFTAGAISGTTEFVAPATGYYYINYRSLEEGQTDKIVSSMTITVCNVAELKEDVDYLLKNVPKKAYTVGADIIRFRPYYGHFLVAERDTIETNKIIAPSQSLFDIEVSARLGFTAIELNAHITSDGHYVCFHGTANKFDGQFELSDAPTGDFVDTPLEDIAVSSVTLADIQASVRNRAKYAKYRTAPNTLEECLNECRRWGIVPFVTFTAGTFPIIKSIVGDDFIGYIGGPSNISPALRELTDAMLFVFDNTTDNVQDVLDNCEALGGCVLYDAAKIDSWNEDLVVDYVETMHNHGHFVAGIPNDIPRRGEPSNQKYLRCNYDALCSGWNINKIENGNICNLSADIDFSGFTHNGSVSNGVLTLANGNTITPNFSIPSVFLGGGYLEIKYIGTLNFVMGDYINYTMSSDKYNVRVFSSAFFESAPTFLITSSGSTTVTGIQFKASKL